MSRQYCDFYLYVVSECLSQNRLLAEEDPQRAQQSEIASHEINEQYIASPSFERIFHTGNEQPEVEWLIRQAKKGWTWTLLLTLAGKSGLLPRRQLFETCDKTFCRDWHLFDVSVFL